MLLMEENKNKNYDDFDMIKTEGENTTEGLFSPFTFIFFVVLITLCGLVMLYSATFDISVRNGFVHYHYLLNQLYGIGFGIALGFILKLVPIKTLKKSYFFLCPFTIIILVLMLFPSFNQNGVFSIRGIPLVSGPLLGCVCVISLLSGAVPSIHDNRIERPGIFFSIVFLTALAIAVLSGLTGGMGYYFLIVIVSIIMLHATGASYSYIFISALFSIATGIFMIFVNPELFEAFTKSIMPVANPGMYDYELFASQLAIKDGGVIGNGIGQGLYKLGILSDVGGKFIFASIAEEIGVLGILFFYIAFICFFFLGIMASRRAYKKHDSALSGTALGLSSMVFVQAIINGLYCAGIFPFGNVDFPFFSYGPSSAALNMAVCFVLYRIIFMMGRGNERR